MQLNIYERILNPFVKYNVNSVSNSNINIVLITHKLLFS